MENTYKGSTCFFFTLEDSIFCGTELFLSINSTKTLISQNLYRTNWEVTQTTEEELKKQFQWNEWKPQTAALLTGSKLIVLPFVLS